MAHPLPYQTLTALNESVLRLGLEFPRTSSEQISDVVADFAEQLLDAHTSDPLAPTAERLARSRLREHVALHAR